MIDLTSTSTSSSTWSWMFTTKSLNISGNFFRFYDYWDYGFITKETKRTEVDEETFINTLRSIKTVTVSASVMCVLLNSILVLSILFNRENRNFVFFPVLFQAVIDILGPGMREKIDIINSGLFRSKLAQFQLMMIFYYINTF